MMGALLVVLGCAALGIKTTKTEGQNIDIAKEFIRAIDIMICELEFHRTPLPTLCAFVSEHTCGVISNYFSELKNELSSQILPDVKSCSDKVLNNTKHIPSNVSGMISILGDSLGIFGIEGQINQLRYVKNMAENTLTLIQKRYDKFGRSRQTLWVCVGIALAVILI